MRDWFNETNDVRKEMSRHYSNFTRRSRQIRRLKPSVYLNRTIASLHQELSSLKSVDIPVADLLDLGNDITPIITSTPYKPSTISFTHELHSLSPIRRRRNSLPDWLDAPSTIKDGSFHMTPSSEILNSENSASEFSGNKISFRCLSENSFHNLAADSPFTSTQSLDASSIVETPPHNFDGGAASSNIVDDTPQQDSSIINKNCLVETFMNNIDLFGGYNLRTRANSVPPKATTPVIKPTVVVPATTSAPSHPPSDPEPSPTPEDDISFTINMTGNQNQFKIEDLQTLMLAPQRESIIGSIQNQLVKLENITDPYTVLTTLSLWETKLKEYSGAGKIFSTIDEAYRACIIASHFSGPQAVSFFLAHSGPSQPSDWENFKIALNSARL